MENLRLYASGCMIVPKKLENGKWAWVVDVFEGDVYYDEKVVDARHYWSEDINDLIGKEGEDD